MKDRLPMANGTSDNGPIKVVSTTGNGRGFFTVLGLAKKGSGQKLVRRQEEEPKRFGLASVSILFLQCCIKLSLEATEDKRKKMLEVLKIDYDNYI